MEFCETPVLRSLTEKGGRKSGDWNKERLSKDERELNGSISEEKEPSERGEETREDGGDN